MPARRLLWVAIALVLLITYLASTGIELIVDYIWLDTMGYGQVFLTILSARIVIGLAGFLTAFLLLWLNFAYAVRQVGDPMQFLPQEIAITPLGQMLTQKFLQRAAAGVSAVIAVLSGYALTASWEKPMLYLNAVSFNKVDPIFGRDASFYVFTVPFLDQIQSFVWSVGFFALLGSGALYLLRMQADKNVPSDVIPVGGFPSKGRLHLAILGAFLLVVMAAGIYLDRFEELHRAGGLFTGPGYAEINGTLPALALKAWTALVAAAVLVFALVRANYRLLIGVAIAFVLVWVGGNVYASLLQRFVVTPNELEKERPFLEHHILATNQAFGLDKIIDRNLDEDVELTARDIANNRPTINNIRLWDHEPLLDTFSQIQEIRTYYEFVSVDNDRYIIDGELRQTMLSPRELNPESLPSRIWINERLTYTHGYGVTVGPVNRVNEQGLPVLFVKDLPPSTTAEELNITDPEIYYGELAGDYVFVKTNQKEFDYPQGDTNIFTTYNGTGGVQLGSLWRRLLFAVYLRDVEMLLSDDFTEETRILLHRNLFKRVRMIAPFFSYDQDPYLVIHEGRLVWILDIYTLTDRYPYSEQEADVGNYMRNPVKALIDAKDGRVTFYFVDPEEPIAVAFAAMFPGLVRPLSEMPAGLRAHLRHPPGYFNIQANMYATYHMLEINTFFNKEDKWSVPVVEQKRMEPYFTVMRLPGEAKEEFILMLPFTPQGKDNLAAWMVARSDGENYGQLVVYRFPKQKLIFGPKQIAARINQDPAVSQQITLWDQSGSNVIRGTLLVIPIESSLIYIQPLYLKAEDGRIPELKRVIVAYQNSIAMGLDLEDALAQIFGSDGAAPRVAGTQAAAIQTRPSRGPPSAPPGADSLNSRALRQYRALNDAARQGDWARFGRELDALGRTLDDLAKDAR